MNRYTATGLAVDLVAGRRVVVICHRSEVRAALTQVAGCELLTSLKVASRVSRANGRERVSLGDGWVRFVSPRATRGLRGLTEPVDVVLVDDQEAARRLATSGMLDDIRPALAPGGEILRA